MTFSRTFLNHINDLDFNELFIKHHTAARFIKSNICIFIWRKYLFTNILLYMSDLFFSVIKIIPD